MRRDGLLPGAIINYLARLGHYYKDNSYMSFKELANQFKEKHLSKSPAKFDQSQLLHWQKVAISHLSLEEVWEWMGEQVHTLVPESLKELFVKTVIPNVVVPDDAFFWANIFFGDFGSFDEEKMAIIKQAGQQFYEATLEALAQHGNDYQKIVNYLKEKLGVKGKTLFMPLRVALTGETHGPELIHIFELLGIDRLERRLNYAKSL